MHTSSACPLKLRMRYWGCWTSQRPCCRSSVSRILRCACRAFHRHQAGWHHSLPAKPANSLRKQVCAVHKKRRNPLAHLCSLWLQVNLSTRPEKFVGSEEIWDQAEADLKAALQRKAGRVEFCMLAGPVHGPAVQAWAVLCQFVCVDWCPVVCALRRAGPMRRTSEVAPFMDQRSTSRFVMPLAANGSAPLYRCVHVREERHHSGHRPIHLASLVLRCMLIMHSSLPHVLQLDFNLPERFDMFYIRCEVRTLQLSR